MRHFLNAALFLFASTLVSCDGPSIRPLQLVVEGKDPEALDWQIPTGLAPFQVLEKLDEARLGALDPLQRAMLQRDLWMVFDVRHAALEPLVGERIAILLRKLALTDEQIRSLPDTYAEATRKFPTQFDPARPDDPFLPVNLSDPNGPWILLAMDFPVAHSHESFFQRRSAFLMFVRHPEGRQATMDYVEKLQSNKGLGVPWRVGMEFILLRKALLINDHGAPVPSSLTESVQVRHFLGPTGSDQAFNKFELHRKDGQLHPFGPGQGKPSYAVSFEHFSARLSLRYPVLDTCKSCHVGPGPFPLGRPNELFGPLRAGIIEREQNAVAKRKEKDDTWKALMELWRK